MRIHERILKMPLALMPFSQSKYGFFSPLWSYKQKTAFSPFAKSSDAHKNASISLSNGVEDAIAGYVFGKKKATEVAHLVWKHVVQKGDTVVDATCGNGYDTLALFKMVGDESGRGRVYAIDIQQQAFQNTTSLLDEVLSQNEKECIKFFSICHSTMESIIPENTQVRVVAFNLGYLPGGAKDITTVPETTLAALEAAKNMIMSGGLISVIVYVGHPGGREELETVEAFANGLSADDWICCKLQMLNRHVAPVPVFLFKR